MNRRGFLVTALATGLTAALPGGLFAAAARFQPTRFSVQVRGEGRDVVLIPGLTSGREVWNGTIAAVPGYRYHLVQVAGFAGEPVRGNREGHVVSPLADEIVRYIADRGLVRPALVGHSMGGTLGMMIGIRNPGLIDRIMVVDMLPQPAGLFGGSAADMGPLADSLMSSASGRRLISSLMSAFSPPNASNRLSDPDVVARAMHDLAGMDLGPQLSRLRAPLTVVYASPDPRMQAAVDRQFTDAYARARGARLVRVERSGHMVMLDQPARFQAELRNFLRA